MSYRLKEIDIKNCTNYFFNDMLNIKILNPNKIRVDEKSVKNILIYYIVYMAVKDLSYAIINGVNPLYPIMNKINGYIEESNGNKYLTLATTDDRKDTLKKY